jgi:TRAP-type C4-dicarboxylate transport system permease large subunit
MYIALGTLFEGISMMLLTLPIIYPIIISLGFNGVWFGIMLTILIETAQVTPPVGFNLYVLQTISGRNIGMIAKNAVPFFLLMVAALIILILFPELALILPNMMVK